MESKVVTHNGKKYHHITRPAGTSLEDIEASRHEFQLLLRGEALELVLSDCREVDFSEVSIIAADNLAKDLRDDVPSCKSLAVICKSPSERIFNHFSNVCGCYGVDVQFFSDIESAEKWLCEQDND